MKKLLNIFLILFLFISLAVPNVSFAGSHDSIDNGLIPCGDKIGSNGEITDECGFNDIIQLINNIINFLIIVAVPIAIILFSYAGFKYVTAAGNATEISKATAIFKNVLIGFLIALFAWAVVNTIVGTLVDERAGFDTFLETNNF